MFVKKKDRSGALLFFPDGFQYLIDVGVVAFSEAMGQLYGGDIEFCAVFAVLVPVAFQRVPASVHFWGIPALIDCLYRLAAFAGGSLRPEFINGVSAVFCPMHQLGELACHVAHCW